MTTMMKKTTILTKFADADRKWFIVDAAEHHLGKLSVVIANALRGRNTPNFTPQTDSGNHVIVINAGKINVTGNKETGKNYYRHSGYTGNLKTETLGSVREKSPERILRDAISGMLPRNKHRQLQMKRLHLSRDENHAHEGQKPTPLISKT